MNMGTLNRTNKMTKLSSQIKNCMTEKHFVAHKRVNNTLLHHTKENIIWYEYILL